MRRFPGAAMVGILMGCILLAFARFAAAEAADHTTNQEVRLGATPDGGVQPQALIDHNGVAHLVYLKGKPEGCDVFYRRREQGQTEFGPALRVNTQPGSAIAIGTVRGAQFALEENGRVHVVWNGSQAAKVPGAKSVPLLYTRLDEKGGSFEPQRNLMTGTINLDGGASVAADGAGNVYAVWHAHAASLAEPDEMNRAVYLRRSTNHGGTFGPEQRINPADRGVCACCALKAFTDSKRRLGVLYRSADDRANRDMTLLVSLDQGRSFNSMLVGKWHVSTCPMSTQALATFDDNTWLAAWETEGQIFWALLDPERLSFKLPPTPASGASGKRKHPSIALSPRSPSLLLLSWAEGTGWDKGGTLGWESVRLTRGTPITSDVLAKSEGTGASIAVWGSTASLAAPDGSFLIFH